MAYQTRLASISEDRVGAFRLNKKESLRASRIIECSHILAYWVQVQPLGKLLHRAIDGGATLDPGLWHPLRPPLIHTAQEVQIIYSELKSAWDALQTEFPTSEGDWYGTQIKGVIDLFAWAQERREAIISIMGLPADAERAKRIIEPRLN